MRTVDSQMNIDVLIRQYCIQGASLMEVWDESDLNRNIALIFLSCIALIIKVIMPCGDS